MDSEGLYFEMKVFPLGNSMKWIHCSSVLYVHKPVSLFFINFFCWYLSILGSNEAGNDTVSEPIETSVVSLDAGMIIVQPVENQANIDDSGPNANEIPIIIDISNPSIVSSQEAENTPSRTKKRKR